MEALTIKKFEKFDHNKILKILLGSRENPNHIIILKIFLARVETLIIKNLIFFRPHENPNDHFF